MNPVIESLYRGGAPDPEAVNNFVHQNQFPLVEPGRVTFVYRGQAEEVYLRRWIAKPFYTLPYTKMQDLIPYKPDPPVGEGNETSTALRYFNFRKATIYAGSNEIQKNIIAKHVLGL